MDWSPKLFRQRTVACPGASDIGSWCNGSRRGFFGFSRGCADGDYDHEAEPLDHTCTADHPTGQRWRTLWRRLVRGKVGRRRRWRRSMCFDCASSQQVRLPYDPYTYAQNFDEGPTSWPEEEEVEYNLSRSFSARFADPSRRLR